jgi:hypothetical protein
VSVPKLYLFGFVPILEFLYSWLNCIFSMVFYFLFFFIIIIPIYGTKKVERRAKFLCCRVPYVLFLNYYSYYIKNICLSLHSFLTVCIFKLQQQTHYSLCHNSTPQATTTVFTKMLHSSQSFTSKFMSCTSCEWKVPTETIVGAWLTMTTP